MAADDHIADPQGAFAHQDRGRRPAGSQARLDHIAFGATVRIGFEFEQVRLQQNHVQQLINALLGQRRDIHENRVAAPIVGHQASVLELLADLHRVGIGMVDFVDGDENGNFGCFGVVERLNRLRHHAVIGGDH